MKPILFNADMVRAILDNRKTVTRRVVKPQPPPTSHVAKIRYSWNWSWWEDSDSHEIKPPYRPGDTLYVLEPWKCRKPPNPSDFGYEVVFKDGEIIKFKFADRERFDKWRKYWNKPDNQWQSPYFMPREAARIFLRVTDVRVERLHEFGIEDAKKEGVVPISRPGGCRCQWAYDGCMEEPCPNRAAYEIERHVDPFVNLWDSTIRPTDRDLYGWLANPWVWVIEFQQINREEVG